MYHLRSKQVRIIKDLVFHPDLPVFFNVLESIYIYDLWCNDWTLSGNLTSLGVNIYFQKPLGFISWTTCQLSLSFSVDLGTPYISAILLINAVLDNASVIVTCICLSIYCIGVGKYWRYIGGLQILSQKFSDDAYFRSNHAHFWTIQGGSASLQIILGGGGGTKPPPPPPWFLCQCIASRLLLFLSCMRTFYRYLL